MPLRGRVGRHANTGKHCQNWKTDQQTVIDLLNRISVAEGGTAGSLGGRTVAGLASAALYQAILAFEKKHFPGAPKGFVDPGGAALAKLEALAMRPAPPPVQKPAGQWDGLTTRSVRSSLTEGLADRSLSHSEAVNIIRSTLSDGVITAAEVNDLALVADKAKSLEPRSQKMLASLSRMIKSTPAGRGPFKFTWDNQSSAADLICAFLERSGRTYFPNLSRSEVGVGMLMRIANPGLFNQSEASLCGPAAIMFSMAADTPSDFARFAIDLFEKGKAMLGRLEITPGSDVRSYVPPQSMDQVDWLTMASIRDSENFLLDYDEVGDELAGITLPGELADWFRRAGYRDVRQNANLVDAMEADALDEASRLYQQGYRTCLFIGADMLSERNQTKNSSTAEHWVVLRSPVDRAGGNVKLKVFTWGDGNYQVPHGSTPLSLGDFLDNFYGYVAGKP